MWQGIGRLLIEFEGGNESEVGRRRWREGEEVDVRAVGRNEDPGVGVGGGHRCLLENLVKRYVMTMVRNPTVDHPIYLTLGLISTRTDGPSIFHAISSSARPGPG